MSDPRLATWQQVADYVDEATWIRILGDLAPTSRAEALACRPARGYEQADLEDALSRHLRLVDPT